MLACKKLARAYIPRQPYEALFPLAVALDRGTIFPSLYQPYVTRCYRPIPSHLWPVNPNLPAR